MNIILEYQPGLYIKNHKGRGVQLKVDESIPLRLFIISLGFDREVKYTRMSGDGVSYVRSLHVKFYADSRDLTIHESSRRHRQHGSDSK